ncbi:MAG: HAD-IIB family hydrolase [Lentisphaeraceae bacterium]|nr:HAD-IIB family hydrolase [Lentisphaeraceae bacterium]
MKKLIFYTDLDGTLLNHDNYCWKEAESQINELKRLKIPIVFNTSKTLKEVQTLQLETGIHDPFVIENGGAVWIPQSYFAGEAGRIIILGKDIQTILESIEPLRSEFSFESYSQMSIQRISELTGLSIDDASLSSQRICSEPFVWNDSEEKLTLFTQKLKEMDFDILKGGRFYHIIGFSGKGDALKFINDKYKDHFPDQEIYSIALGDSPNDLSMLEVADLAVVIPRADGNCISPSNENTIIADYKGAKGWSQAAEKILIKNSERRL